MNTPAHVLVSLGLLGGGGRRGHSGWIVAGALLPDLPMLLFFLFERVGGGASHELLWSTLYFEPEWQRFFDLFNSLPLLAVAWAAAHLARRDGAALLFASAVLHCLFDAPLHREDGHRHLWPLSDWRFMSPVSYWDPAHGGVAGSLLEWLLVAATSAVLWRRHPKRWVRATLVATNAFYVVAWAGFYG